uniref:Uncharacterized protein n=1 Tax=Pithovirus LCPAC406 TaxID=2506599 RepID=A0A481ZD66_9VIRU|nr:MAG: hypothetical protein LCPAC406_01620 [Pithovirus LCPAC406]
MIWLLDRKDIANTTRDLINAQNVEDHKFANINEFEVFARNVKVD